MIRTKNTTRLLLPTLLLCAVVLCLAGCRKDQTCGVPHGDGAIVDLSLPEMSDLQIPYRCVVINRGHKGIAVLRISIDNEFRAYECACPKDNGTAVEPSKDFAGLVQCPSCQSIFNLLADGTPIGDAATPCSLYEYGTTMDNDGYHLHIY